MIFLGYRKTNTVHKKICVKIEVGEVKNNQDSNEQSKQSFVRSNAQKSLLLSSACHDTDAVRVSVRLRWALQSGLWSLRPRICLTGGVSVGVQLVICTSTQHQLKTDKKETAGYTSILCVFSLFFCLFYLSTSPPQCPSYPTFCPVHTKHFVLVGRQVVQRSLTAGRHESNICMLTLFTECL